MLFRSKSITANTLCIGIDSDNLFPPHEMENISKTLEKGCYKEIKSLYGHDGFLLEFNQLIDKLTDWGVNDILKQKENLV